MLRRTFAARMSLAGLGIVIGRLSRARAGRAGRVVAYVALDREFSEPILVAHEKAAGVEVLGKYDVESTKTVGLVNLIVAEADRPRCDLFWNNEILGTIRLARKGLLTPFTPGRADEIPPEFRAKDRTWYGFAARARVLIVNTRLVGAGDRPTGIESLTDPEWRDKIGIAKPLFGTTATHAACLFASWGDDRAKAYYRSLKANGARVYSGNKGVAAAVGSGEIPIGITDTDDAMVELDAGQPVAVVYPDQAPGGLGTLFLPNTIALPKGAPNSSEARALADAILSPAVEGALADGPSAQIPLLKSTRVRPRVETPRTVRAMAVDFEAAADAWERAAAFLAAEFGG